jgi:hypothetical protein
MVKPIVACVTSGFSAPGVLVGSGNAPCPTAGDAATTASRAAAIGRIMVSQSPFDMMREPRKAPRARHRIADML